MENKYFKLENIIELSIIYRERFEEYNSGLNPHNLLVPRIICHLSFDDFVNNPEYIHKLTQKEAPEYISQKIISLLDAWDIGVANAAINCFNHASKSIINWHNNINSFLNNQVLNESNYLFNRYISKNKTSITVSNKVLGLIKDYFFLDAIIKSIKYSYPVKQEFLNIYNALDLFHKGINSSYLRKVAHEDIKLTVKQVSLSPVAFDFSGIIQFLEILENRASAVKDEKAFKQKAFSDLVYLELLYNRKLIWNHVRDIIEAFDIEHNTIQSKCEFIYFLLQSIDAPEVIGFNEMKNNIPDPDDPLAVKNFDKKIKATIKKLGLL